MFEIFKIGFISFTAVDVIDIAIVSLLTYQIYKLIRGTVAAQILLGLMALLLLSFIAQLTGMRTLTYILKLITDVWVIAFVVLFQPELRRFLMMLSKSRIIRFFSSNKYELDLDIAEELTEAAFEMSQHQHGALIVLERSAEIKAIIDTGVILNAKLSKELLRNIFFPRSPLHDGAVIVKNNLIKAARCTLPLSNKSEVDGISLGMRHKAGLGISEQSDVISLIVSEETGGISLAEDGKLTRGLSKESLKAMLNEKLNLKPQTNARSIFEQFWK
jgi:diadenylate cyclase